MKKYFIFAAIAAAGLLTSCSSSDDAISEGSVPPIEQGDDLVPIQIGVGQRASAEVTRGTGTVGGTTDAANIWQGEHVNVYMFHKGSITKFGGIVYDANDQILSGEALYNNTEMRAPQTDANAQLPDQIKEYVLSDFDNGDDKTYVKHKYYPAQGRFDFWGYHVDDAANGQIINAADEIQVPFQINGTQDLMAAAAKPVQGTTYWESQSGVASTIEVGTGATPNDNFAYSAKSARANLQPELQFEHLLTRLVFQVKGGNLRSLGWVDLDGDSDVDTNDGLPTSTYINGNGTPGTDHPDAKYYNGVFVRDIKVYSRESGKLVAAYDYGYDPDQPTTNTPSKTAAQLIHWDYPGNDAACTYESYKNGITTQDVVPFALTNSTKWDNTAAAVPYTAGEAEAYNNSLPDALPVNGTTPLTADQANAYNATLNDAIAAGTALTQAQADAVNTALTTNYVENDQISAADAAAYNATLIGAVVNDGTGTLAAAAATAYNASLPGAVSDQTVKIPAHKEGDVKPLYDETTLGTIESPIENAWKTALDLDVAAADQLKDVWCPDDITTAKQVGGALLVSPEEKYRVVVTLGEYRLDLSAPTETETGETAGTKNKYSLQFDTLAPIDITYTGGFLPGTSYNVVLTIYNAQEIIITANLSKWTQAGSDVEETLE